MPSLPLLGLASSLSVFGMAIVVPAIANIATEFDADVARVQFVVSAYLFGLAVAQPVSGYLCDRFGRRPVMLAGFSLFIVASAVAAIAPVLDLLIVSRFLQAVGVSVGTVATRAILRDTRDGEEMAEALSYIAIAMGIAPIIAPIFGGLLDSTFGFRSIFLLTAAMGIVVFVSMYRHLGETLQPENALPDLARWIAGYGMLLRSGTFIGYTLVYGFVQGTFFSFLAIGAPFFESAFGVDSKAFGFLWGALAITYVVGATAGARLTPHIGADGVMRWSVRVLLAGGVLLLVAVRSEPLTPIHVLGPLGVLMVVAGAATPGAMAGAVRYHPRIAGTASGLSSAIGLVLGGGFTIVSGILYEDSFWPIALLMAGCCVATGLGWLLASNRTVRSHRPATPPRTG